MWSIELARALPKTDLHCHLDGSLRLSTIVELSRARGLTLPAEDAAGLGRRLHVGEICESLAHYLEAFAVTLAVMQDAESLSRVTRELIDDAADDGVWAIEIRFSPALHQDRGMSGERALEAVLEGARAGRAARGIQVGVIVCGLRHLPPAQNEELARLAVRARDEGVVAFDLAGGEVGAPARPHARAFEIAREGDLRLTAHAGEAAGADSIRDALHGLGAHRIGHGVRLFEDRRLLALVNDRRVALEVCPTSNEQTRAVASFAAHPMRAYLREGLLVTLNTDNRLMSDTSSTRELHRVATELALTKLELRTLLLNGFEAAFLHEADKRALVARATREIDRLLDANLATAPSA